MYNDIDKKFDLATKKALPYLVLAPPAFRKELSELMEVLFHQLLQRSEADFETHYAQINDIIDNRKKFESNLEVRVHNFARRFVSQEETIALMDRQLVKLENRAAKSERKIKSLEKSVKTLYTTKEEIQMDALPKEEIQMDALPKEEIQMDALPKEEIQMDALPKERLFCEFCENSKLTKVRKRYYDSANATLTIYACPLCHLEFKFDDNGNNIPVTRNKGTLERAEQRRNKR